jgi:small-conductance mechanosensitive channel
MKWWKAIIEANDLLDWTLAAAIVLGAFVALWTLRRYGPRLLARALRGIGRSRDDAIAGAARATSLALLLPVALYAGAQALTLPAKLDRLVEVAALLVLLVQAALWANCALAHWLRRRVEVSRDHDPEAATAMSLIGFGVRAVLWAIVLLLALEQLGFNITALVAGLGIGGAALALAVQSILADLFASLSIVLDKPFVVGDFIIVDSLRGTVEHVGLKTTRLRSLDGELLVFSNTDLLKSRIRNFRRMYERRVECTLAVHYETPPDKLRRIPQWLREIVEAQNKARLDRAHFRHYGDSALVFEYVYYVGDPDYNVYMDTQHAINLAIHERFGREQVRFAYPTRTLYLERARA